MTPRVKFGLIVGLIGLVLNVCISGLVGLCGPFAALLAGAVAGFLAAQQEKAMDKGNGARLGAAAGGIAGALVLIGQLLGVLGSLAFTQFSGAPPLFGSVPSPSADAPQQIAYYASGLGVGLCFGIVGLIAATLAGAAAGYVGTPEQTPFGHP